VGARPTVCALLPRGRVGEVHEGAWHGGGGARYGDWGRQSDRDDGALCGDFTDHVGARPTMCALLPRGRGGEVREGAWHGGGGARYGCVDARLGGGGARHIDGDGGVRHGDGNARRGG